MKKLLILAAILFPISSIAQPAIMPPKVPPETVFDFPFNGLCGDYKWMLEETVKIGMGDTIIFTGFSNETGLVSYLITDDLASSYSFFVRFPNGMVCLLSSGEYFDLALIPLRPTY